MAEEHRRPLKAKNVCEFHSLSGSAVQPFVFSNFSHSDDDDDGKVSNGALTCQHHEKCLTCIRCVTQHCWELLALSSYLQDEKTGARRDNTTRSPSVDGRVNPQAQAI